MKPGRVHAQASTDPARLIVAVPWEALQPLRESVYGEIWRVAEGVLEAAQSADRSLDRASLLQGRAEVDRACALLDEIGWTQASGGSVRRVNVVEHRVALLVALRGACADTEHAREDVTAGRQSDPDEMRAITRRAAVVHEFLEVVASHPNRCDHDGADGMRA
jgi:hypothetical protein